MIEAYLTNHGYTVPGREMRDLQKLWAQWYRGFVDNVHCYRVYDAMRGTVQKKRRVLGMAKTVCEDFGCLLMNEHVQITADGFEKLPDILRQNKFMTRMNRLAEYTMATGTGAVVVFPDENKNLVIDYIRADMVYPISWDNDNVTECAFASNRVMVQEDGKTKEVTYVQIHRRKGDGWVIHNVYLDSAGKEIPLPAGMLEETPVSPVPLFQIVRPNNVNTADPDSPLGASVFADALEQLADCDIIWDSYINEFVLGKKRLMIPTELATIQLHKTDEEGGEPTLSPIFDPEDALIYVYEAEKSDKPIELDMNLRTDAHDQGLQRAVDMLSKKCGLGMGRYKVDADGVKTATEVVSAKSDLYQSLKRHEKTFGDAIIGMVRALAWLSGLDYNMEVSIKFDDSIIEDENAMLDRCIKMVANGFMSRKRAIMHIEKVDEETADQYLAEMAQEARMTQAAVETVSYTSDIGGDL